MSIPCVRLVCDVVDIVDVGADVTASSEVHSVVFDVNVDNSLSVGGTNVTAVVVLPFTDIPNRINTQIIVN